MKIKASSLGWFVSVQIIDTKKGSGCKVSKRINNNDYDVLVDQTERTFLQLVALSFFSNLDYSIVEDPKECGDN